LRLLSFITIISVAIAGCSNPAGSNNGATNPQTIHYADSKLDSAGTKQVVVLLQNYLRLKDALVEANTTVADSAAIKVKDNITALTGIIAADSAVSINLQAEADSLLAALDVLLNAESEIEHKRIPFEKVSGAVYALAVKAGVKNAGIYRQYCPMALNDKGAYWLSNSTEIRNPYFGTIMLECGEVTDTL